jgi:hypothetical protein
LAYYSHQSSYNNVIINKYKKTKLSITYQRDSSDNFITFNAAPSYLDDNINNIRFYYQNRVGFYSPYAPIIPSTSIEETVAANFWTKILKRKDFSNGTNQILYSDSIYCLPNIVNNITVKY